MSARWKNVLPAVFDDFVGEGARRFRFVNPARSITAVVILCAASSFTSVCMHANEPGGSQPAPPPFEHPVTSQPTVPLPVTQQSDIERRTREEDAQIENIDTYAKGAGLSHYLENPRRCRRLINLMHARQEAWKKIISYAQDPNNRSAVERIRALFNFDDKYRWLHLDKNALLFDNKNTFLERRVAAWREEMKGLFQKIREGDRAFIDPDARAEMAR